MAVCLLPEKIAEFRQALKNKELDIKKLIEMSTEERTAALEEYAGENAKDVNTLFEQKLVLKNRVAGLKNWASKMGMVGKYSEEGSAEVAKAIADYRAKQQERIFSPEENEAFLNDLADKKLGIHVSREVAAKVFELSQKAAGLKEKNAKMSGVSDEYLLAKKELDDYVRSQEKTGISTAIGKDLATIARNNLLLNPSTPIKTTIGQTMNSALDMVTRRMGALSVGGANGELARAANAEAWETFRKTGQNTAAMESLDDMHSSLGEKHSFDTPADANIGSKAGRTIAKVTGAVARASNKVAILYEHQYSFTKFHQKAFFDMANLTASKMAEAEGLSGSEANARAAEIFKDAARIEPETAVGALVRQQSQMQAARVTSTNKTWVSDIALRAKNILNEYTPNFPMGNILIPIAKIPANIIWNGIENAGAGIPTAVKDIYQGRMKIQSADLSVRYEGMAQFANGIQRASRIGGTMGVAFLLSQSIPKQNFRQDQYGTTFVKIGDTWINAEYFSAISPALSGFMSVRANGKKKPGAENAVANYVMGASAELKGITGIEDALKIFQDPNKYAKDFFDSRGVPVFMTNLLKDRPIDRLFWGAHGIESQEDVNKDKAKKSKSAPSLFNAIGNMMSESQPSEVAMKDSMRVNADGTLAMKGLFGSKKEYTLDPTMGMGSVERVGARAAGTVAKVSAEKMAGALSAHGLKAVQEFVNHGSLSSLMKLQPLIEKAGLEKFSLGDIKGYLLEVIQHKGGHLPGALIEG